MQKSIRPADGIRMKYHKTFNQALWSPSVMNLSDKAFRTWSLMRAYVSQHETDGFLPAAASMMFDPVGFEEVCQTELVERSIAGWMLTGWLAEEEQMSKAQYAAACEKNRLRQARYRTRKKTGNEASNGVTSRVTDGVSNGPLEVEVEVDGERRSKAVPLEGDLPYPRATA